MPTPTEHIAFVCAMPMELEPLTRKLGLVAATVGDLEVQVGEVGGHPVVGIVTGMGPALAVDGTTRLLDALAVRWVLVVGITGAVDGAMPIGTLVMPEAVVDGATGAEFRPAPIGSAVPSGKMWTTDVLLTDPEVVAGLGRQGVVSLDMETAAIAELCERRAIPWSVFRVISDRASDGSIDDEVFHLSNMDGSPNNDAIERFFAEHPERLEAMARLAEGATLGAERAADAAIEACSVLVG